MGVSACQVCALKRRKYKRKPFKPIDKDQFREVRMTLRLSHDEVAGLLHVTARTVAHWECGVTRIPYSAFKLLRCLVNGELIPKAWDGWTIRGDTLYSPVGRQFRAYELVYLTNYFTMARFWQADYELRQSQKQQAEVLPLRLVTSA